MGVVMQEPKVIVALDYANEVDALAFVERVSPELCRLKVGKEMFTLFGPAFVRTLVSKGFDVFLDLKFHDIPNTVAKAVAASAELGVWMVNVHASGGLRMMTAAKEALQPYGERAPHLIAVTVLTSMEQDELARVGVSGPLQDHVLRLAALTQEAGLDGVVCSAQEASLLKSRLGQDFKLITPGIRPAGAELGDQRRVLTPVEACAQGSDYLVIGRPITQASDPAATLKSINDSLA
ncbi:MAG: orotidine-5'-phosphate decarboxylase [Moraxellaceae bacterium]|nr:orotidine-5'-phosphate decarboxylase [Moraxellaceae bacterium]